jgi:Carbamoylphosphate synthase small subunit
LPADSSAEDVLSHDPDGVMLSNGPGDPKDVPTALEMIRGVEKAVPLFGICLGHQLFALANGANTFKMKFGHRGFNHPVRELATGRIDFTSQNHGYAVDRESLKDTDLEVTHEEINDQTVEGIKHKIYPAFSVQYHPDAAPGPHDADYLFDRFMKLIDENKEKGKVSHD